MFDEYMTNYPDYEWATKDDDFFPYASGEHSYWTGFFTSRPTLKYMERQHNNLLQAAKQVKALMQVCLLHHQRHIVCFNVILKKVHKCFA